MFTRPAVFEVALRHIPSEKLDNMTPFISIHYENDLFDALAMRDPKYEDRINAGVLRQECFAASSVSYASVREERQNNHFP